MPRKPNAFYDAAKTITDIMSPDARLYNSTLAMNMKHLSMLCGKKAKESGETVYDLDDVLDAFPLLKAEMDALGFGCNLLTLLKGSPKRNIDRLIELPDPPAVYEASAFDDYVRIHAKRLRKNHFVYRWSCEAAMFDHSRITWDEAQSLGLTDE